MEIGLVGVRLKHTLISACIFVIFFRISGDLEYLAIPQSDSPLYFFDGEGCYLLPLIKLDVVFPHIIHDLWSVVMVTLTSQSELLSSK